MTLKVSRPQTLVFLAIVSAVAVTIVSAPGKASAAHEDCTLTTGAPTSFYGSAHVLTTATVECNTVKNTIRIFLVLTRDGTVVDSGDRTCHKRADCWTYLIAPDPPGNQVWCTHASARIGAHSLPEVTLCEDTEL